MIGSHTKWQTILEYFRAEGCDNSTFRQVYVPMGLDPGGILSKEMAAVVLEEIIAVRRVDQGGSCSRAI